MDMYCSRGEVKISKAENGYALVMRDPAIDKANAKRSLKDKSPMSSEPYREPVKQFVFTKLDDLLKYLSKNIDKALPEDNYESAFEALADQD